MQLKELNKQRAMEFRENCISSQENKFFESPASQSLPSFPFNNQKDDDLWEDPSNADTRT
jgi:hypothetical protein